MFFNAETYKWIGEEWIDWDGWKYLFAILLRATLYNAQCHHCWHCTLLKPQLEYKVIALQVLFTPVSALIVLWLIDVEEEPMHTLRQLSWFDFEFNLVWVWFCKIKMFFLVRLYFGFFNGELFFGMSAAHLLWQRLISENQIKLEDAGFMFITKCMNDHIIHINMKYK